MEQRDKLAMEPVYADDNIIGPSAGTDPKSLATVTVEFAADLRRVIKSIRVSPDLPDKSSRLRKGETRPVQLEGCKFDPARCGVARRCATVIHNDAGIPPSRRTRVLI